MNKHLLLLLLLAAPAAARSVKVARLDQSLEPILSTSSYPAFYGATLSDGAGIYFTRSDHAFGNEWWYSNGTPAGTRLVANFYEPNNEVGSTTAIMRNGALHTSRSDQSTYYLKFTGGSTVEVLPQPGPTEWSIGEIIGSQTNGVFYLMRRRTDGGYTDEKCFFRADTATSPLELFDFDDDEDTYMMGAGGKLFYITGFDEERGVFASDGTAAGTHRLPVAWDESLGWLGGGYSLDWNGLTWFISVRWVFDAASGTYGEHSKLWRSDGTAAGTIMTADLGGMNVHNLIPLGSELFSLVQDSGQFKLLRIRMGQPPVTAVNLPPVSGINPTWKYLGRAGGRVVLSESGGATVWTTNGTQAGTQQVAALPSFPSSGPPLLPDAIEFNGYVYIWSHLDGTTKMSRTNGTAWELVQTYSFFGNRTGQPFRPQVSGPYLFYTAIYDDEVWLWRTDSTTAGTIRLVELTERPQTGLTYLQRSPRRFAFGGNSTRLHVSDGSPAGTAEAGIPQRYLLPRYDSTDGHFAATQQAVSDPNWSLLKWWPDGSTQTVAASADWQAGANAFYSPRDYLLTPHPLTLLPVGLHGRSQTDGLHHPRTHALGTSHLIARTGSRDIFLLNTEGAASMWSSDGTAAGSFALPNSAIGEYWRLRILPADGGSFLLTTDEGRTMRWCDGVNLPPLSTAEICPHATVLGDTLFFTRHTAATGIELWKWTRGSTPALVKDIWPGTASSGPGNLRALQGRLWFSCNDGVHGYEPWLSDGTAAGTVMVADCHPGTGHSGPADFAEAGDCICFVADNGTAGRELWQSRGTTASTVMTDTTPGAPSRLPFALETWGGSVIFLDHDFISGTPGINVSTFTPDPTPAWKVWALSTFPGGSEAGPLTFAPRANPDSDAADNFGEYAFGTDPKDGTHAPALTQLPSLPGCLSVLLRARQDPGLVFHMECSTNLSTWSRWSFHWNGSTWISLSPGLTVTPGGAQGGASPLSLCIQGIPPARCCLRATAAVQ